MDGKKYFVFCVYFFLDCAALRCHYECSSSDAVKHLSTCKLKEFNSKFMKESWILFMEGVKWLKDYFWPKAESSSVCTMENPLLPSASRHLDK
jgi:hypothetical protein